LKADYFKSWTTLKAGMLLEVACC